MSERYSAGMFTYPAYALASVSQMWVSLYVMEAPGTVSICFVVTSSRTGGKEAAARDASDRLEDNRCGFIFSVPALRSVAEQLKVADECKR